MIEIPEPFFEGKFFEHVGFAKRGHNGKLSGCCPFCMEGTSWGKKKRFHYNPQHKYCKCYNCGIYCDQTSFLMKMEGMSFGDVLRMVKDAGGEFIDSTREFVNNWTTAKEVSKDVILPPDAINLFDSKQVEFYEGDYFVDKAVAEIKKRRLDVAENRGDLYISREDFVHKNRIIIPFKNEQGELTFYQSRSQTDKQLEFGKYLSATNGYKTFYGLDKIDHSLPHVFVLEGPLDCFFVPNSIGGGGTNLNNAQNALLDDLDVFGDLIYCLDNDFNNKEVLKYYLELIKSGKKVFFWGGKFAKYKDFNEYCIGETVNVVKPEQILEHTYSGKPASEKLVEKLRSIQR